MLAALAPCRAEFALRDSDRVVFLGNSITTAQRYDRIIENYTLLRFPKLCVQFFNAGKGGDTAAGGLARPRAAGARRLCAQGDGRDHGVRDERHRLGSEGR